MRNSNDKNVSFLVFFPFKLLLFVLFRGFFFRSDFGLSNNKTMLNRFQIW